MPYASVNGVQLYYEERGSGTPILGIHGAGSSALFWTDAAEKLAQHGRAIVYDRRGCNRSERPEPYETTTVQEHAADALALLRELDAEPAILIGRSYGGTVVLDLALQHPDSVVGIALLEAGPMGLSPEYDAWFTSLRDRSEAVEPEAVGEVVMGEVFGAWDELPHAWRDVFTRNGPALLAELRGGERTDNDRFGELAVPALVVTAEASPDPIRRCSEALGRALPGARSAAVGGDHAIDPAGPDVLQLVAELAHSGGSVPDGDSTT
jgi:pimeloyl-ACP methyl ester carboxylesterase